MSQIASPWLSQLTKRRPFTLEQDAGAQVAIVGGGIAGLSTAAYLMKDTDLSVVLVEAGRIAHGATGHNAGQLVAEFERPLSSLIEEYGLEMSVRAQTEVDGGWIGVDWIISEFGLRTPLYRCQGFSGFSTPEQVRSQLDAAALWHGHGLQREPLIVAVGSEVDRALSRADESMIVRMPHSVILRLLDTDDPSFMAVATSPKGCMNSALFCEELAGSLLAKYPGRFTVAEHLPVHEAVIGGDGVVLKTDGPSVRADSVVLCTNGFESIRITNTDGPEIDRSFHRMVEGVLGYMGGYTESAVASANAIAYFRRKSTDIEPYVYLTRRPYEKEGIMQTLLCLGGPARILPDGAEYDPLMPFPADIEEEIDMAFASIYREKTGSDPQKAFLWHGVMGYTPTGIRCVGRDPRASRLLYNLGCNGVGILPSIAGGRRIARMLSGATLEPSLFDPEVQMR